MSEIKYTAQGQRCQILSELPSGKFLVAGAVGNNDYDDECYFDLDHPRVVDRVFDTAPVEIYDKRVASLLDELGKLEERRNALRTEISTSERQHKDRIQKLAKFQPLQRIEDFLDGKITHYVISEGYHRDEDGHYQLKISTPQQEKSGDECHSRELKLLTLYGKSDRSVEWKLNYYSDGSGSSSHFCWPCTSIEEAKALAARLFEEACRKILANNNQARYANYLLQSACAIGVTPPEWVAASSKKASLEYAQREVAEAQRALEAANARLAMAQG